jgi:hypothetical protein
VLVENQGGRQFPKHIERLVPCNLSNVEGTVHPEFIKPSWNFPCSVCADHRSGSRMLLCDGCNMGYHTFCLTLPLDDVPDGIWICPTCTQFGVTEAHVIKRRENYIPVEDSRPYIELPSPQRRAKARRSAAEWHGRAVQQTTKAFERIGRLIFTGVSEMKWFQIAWLCCGKAWSLGFGLHFRLPQHCGHLRCLSRNRGSVALITGAAAVPRPWPVGERDSGARSHGELAPKGSLPLARHLGGERGLFLQHSSPPDP